MQRKFLSFLLAFSLFVSFAGCGELYDASFSSEIESIYSEVYSSSSETQSVTLPSSSRTELSSKPPVSSEDRSLYEIPEYSGKPYVVLNNNEPVFSKAELTTSAYEYYAPLDSLGRCGEAVASCGKELMPDGERGSISSIYPTGWKQAKYDNVSGKYLYNRCHLIGWQLSGENANRCNLITGTRYMNTKGMLPFENMVADYIRETGNHVAYRITPVFDGNNLLCSGVRMEAYSIEDEGDGICFNVYCYNVQPDIKIDYKTGKSSGKTAVVSSKPTPKPSSKPSVSSEKEETVSADYILNTNSKKIHYPSCGSVKLMSEKNKQEYSGSIDDLLDRGYTTCGNCFR